MKIKNLSSKFYFLHATRAEFEFSIAFESQNLVFYRSSGLTKVKLLARVAFVYSAAQFWIQFALLPLRLRLKQPNWSDSTLRKSTQTRRFSVDLDGSRRISDDSCAHLRLPFGLLEARFLLCVSSFAG